MSPGAMALVPPSLVREEPENESQSAASEPAATASEASIDNDLLLPRPKRYKPAITPEDDLTEEEREELITRRLERPRDTTRTKPVHRTRGESHENDEEDEEFDLEDDDDDEFGDEFGESRAEMSKQLLSLSRVPYRHVTPIPEWLDEKQKEISSHRTNAQIRRCLKSWMVKYDAELMQKYRMRSLGWKEESPHEAALTATAPKHTMVYGPEETAAYAYFHMPARFAVQKRVFSEIKQLLQQQPSSNDVNNNNNNKQRVGFSPKRILDFGCGPATAAAAAYEIWPDEITHYAGIDVSQSMLDAGRIVTRDLLPNATFWSRNADIVQRALTKNERFDLVVASYTLTELPTDTARKAATQLLYELLDVNGVLVLIEAGSPFGSHTVRTARQFLLDMMKSVDEHGQFTSTNYLALHAQLKENEQRAGGEGEGEDEMARKKNEKRIRSATKSTNLMILPPPLLSLPLSPSPLSSTQKNASQQRSSATEKHDKELLKHNDLYAKIVAPCTHDRACPLRTGTWCSFSQRVHTSTIRKDSEEKYSYVVVQKLLKPTVSSMSEKSDEEWVATTLREMREVQRVRESEQFARGSPLELLSAMLTPKSKRREEDIKAMIDEIDWATYQPRLKREEFARLLRSPLKGRGHITMDLCLPDGTITRHVHARSDVPSMPRLYNSMRKAAWGGLVPAMMIPHTHTTTKQSRVKETAQRDEFLARETRRGLRKNALSKNDFDAHKLEQALDEFLFSDEFLDERGDAAAQQSRAKSVKSEKEQEQMEKINQALGLTPRSKSTRRRVRNPSPSQ